MKSIEAIIKRINYLITKKNTTISKAAVKSGINPSTLIQLMNGRNKSVEVVTLSRLCYYFGISLREFFDDELFDNVFDD